MSCAELPNTTRLDGGLEMHPTLWVTCAMGDTALVHTLSTSFPALMGAQQLWRLDGTPPVNLSLMQAQTRD